MKKLCVFLIIQCLLLLPCLTAYAEVSAIPEPVIAEEAPQADTESPTSVPIRDMGADIQPVSIDVTPENGVILIKKTYEVPHGIDPQTLIEPFNQYGFDFNAREILQGEVPGESESRHVEQTAATESESKNEEDVLKQFPESIDFEDDGYSGQLHLDVTTLKIETENGRHTATVIYYGNITKETPGKALYTIVYEGAPEESEHAETDVMLNTLSDSRAASFSLNNADNNRYIYLLPLISCVLFLIGAIVVPVYAKRKLKKEHKQPPRRRKR